MKGTSKSTLKASFPSSFISTFSHEAVLGAGNLWNAVDKDLCNWCAVFYPSIIKVITSVIRSLPRHEKCRGVTISYIIKLQNKSNCNLL